MAASGPFDVGNSESQLLAVSALSPNDVWAVGHYSDSGMIRSLTMHWDGNQWAVVPSVDVDPENNRLEGVVAVNPNDVWAVGYYSGNFRTLPHTLVEHWDGQKWTVVQDAANPDIVSHLNAITALGPNDVWAVGFTAPGGRFFTFVEHWDGNGWAVVPSADPSYDQGLSAITALSPDYLWAVGVFATGGYDPQRTLTEVYNNPCISPTPRPTRTAGPTRTATASTTPVSVTPTSSPSATATRGSPSPTQTSIPETPLPSQTPGGPSATPNPPTNTPGAATTTPTSCPIQFVDVPVDHTFYTFIRCLACRNIIGGYQDGTFRPGNDITGGRLLRLCPTRPPTRTT